MKRADFDDFVTRYKPGDLAKRKPTWSESQPYGRWRAFAYDELSSAHHSRPGVATRKQTSCEGARPSQYPRPLRNSRMKTLKRQRCGATIPGKTAEHAGDPGVGQTRGRFVRHGESTRAARCHPHERPVSP